MRRLQYPRWRNGNYGQEEFKLFYDRMRSAFSDMRELPSMVLALRWPVTARHTGDGSGMAALGRA